MKKFLTPIPFKITKSIGLLLLILTIANSPLLSKKKEVNVYSYRQPFLINPILDAFSKKTGVKVNVVFAKKGLIERLKNEGKRSPADVILTVGIGNAQEIVAQGLARKVKSKTLRKNIPAKYRDPKGFWYALTTRARIIYASKDRVPENLDLTYEDLADPKWKGKICTRSGYHNYNIALFSSMLLTHGEKKTQEWLENLKKNLARKPQGNDRAQVKAIKEGECDLAIGNSYYYGKMLLNYDNPEEIEWAKSVRLIFPNQKNRGTHVNVSTVIMAKYAPNRKYAAKLMNFLSDTFAQYIYANNNYEFPIKKDTPLSPLVKKYMGQFKADDADLTKIANLRKQAAKMVDTIQFND